MFQLRESSVTHPRSILSVLTLAALGAVYRELPSPPRLEYVATAHQAGPVGFRDPQGAVSPDGKWLAYTSNRHLFLYRIDSSSTTELLPADHTKGAVRWFSDSRSLAVVELPFGGVPHWLRYDVATGTREPVAAPPDQTNQTAPPIRVADKIWGTSAYSPDRRMFYYSVPNARGTLDLWSRNLDTGEASQLTRFDRDTYEPSVTAQGDVLFKVQIFNAVVGWAPSAGGPTRVLTTFQSETPTWSPDGTHIGLTFGSWRRVIDDARYPDIAQDLGVVPASASTPAERPARIVQASESEDQGMVWSPDGKWIAFHSHRNRTDDIFLQFADGSQPPRQITTGGLETGWPRWSPDGRWIAYSSYPGPYLSTHSNVYVLGIDPTTGQVTHTARPVAIEGQTESASEPNWMPDSNHIVFESQARVGARKSLAMVSRTGGRPRRIVEFESDQTVSGISASPDGKWLAYVAPTPDRTYQIFRISERGGAPQQVTTDPNHKAQPSFSPDGTRVAFTMWRYDVQFWILRRSE